MKKLGLFAIALGAALFMGNVGAVTINLEKVTVVNKTKGDIWITWNLVSDSCIGQCNYKRIQPGGSLSTQGSLYKKNLNVYAYEGTSGIGLVKKGYRAETGKVEVSIDTDNKGNKQLLVTEPGK